MGLLDSLKGLFGGKKDEIDSGIDSASDVADDRTGGDPTEPIDTAADATTDETNKLTE